MAFLSQLQGGIAQLKQKAEAAAPSIAGSLNQLKEAPKFMESAFKTGLNKVKLDSLGKVLNVPSLGRSQSPIDIVPVITAFGEHLQNAHFEVTYESTGDFKAVNDGNSVWLMREGNSSELAISFLPEEQYHLDAINFHWATEPMNGSEHTIGGVGYAGEMHLIHRNTRFATMADALKQPNGVIAIAVFLNESHDDNPTFSPLINLLPQIIYKGSECKLCSFDFQTFFPIAEKTKEFWMYEGSETTEPFRETVNWIVIRAALPISSHQLDKLREVRAGRYDEEFSDKVPMKPLRSIQAASSRTIQSSFRSAAGAPDLGFRQ
uniref:Carbonic anhydrase n=1 Tax=Caenorhabditis tropicalis TaxID=1561998 RepID=A0A1I7TKB9_9PELO